VFTAARRFLTARRRFVDHVTTVDGLTATARCAGEPRSDVTVVLLAGLGLAGNYMLPLGGELAERCRVWVPMIPGFGWSDRPPEPLDIPAMGEFVIAWARAVGIERAVMVGNSMGCQVAVEAALHAPDIISHLVLDGPTIDSRARTVPRLIMRVAVDALREPASLAAVQAFEWLGTGPRRLAKTTRFAVAHAIEQRVRAVTCPVLVVRSRNDPFVPQPWAEEIASSAGDATIRVIDEGTHALPYSNPHVLAQVTVDFVSHR